MMGSGSRVSLKFDAAVKVRGGPKGVGGVGLFPGAIVALRGKNGGGGWFLVEEILAVGLPVLFHLFIVFDDCVDASHEVLADFLRRRNQTRTWQLRIFDVHS